MSLCDAKSAKNQEFTATPTRTTEYGSVIIWIFLMIALLAALYYTFSSGFRSGEGQLTKEKQKLLASEVIEYGQLVRKAVQELLINGCDETEISFEGSPVGDFITPNANSFSPTDNSCDVFHPNGGGINPNDVKTLTFLNSDSTYSSFRYGRFNSTWFSRGIGSDSKTELQMILGMRNNLALCSTINNLLNVENPSGVPPNLPGSVIHEQFNGIYYDPPDVWETWSAASTVLNNKTEFCISQNDRQPDLQHFVQILIAR